MLKFIVVLLVTVNSAFAHDMAIGLGILNNNHEIDESGFESDQNTKTIQVGGLYYYSLLSNIELRTGLLYTQKNVHFSAAENTFNIRYHYLDIPLTVQYNFDLIDLGIIAGVDVQINTWSECDQLSEACEDVAPESTVIPLSLGVSQTLNDLYTFELIYQYALNETDTNLKINSLIFNIMFQL